jgi:hypothetical protein
MKVARLAFLQAFNMTLTASSHDDGWRSVLHRSSNRFSEWVWRDSCQVIRAVRDEVQRGSLIFVPKNDDLRACVKAIQEKRQQQPARFVPRAVTQQMCDETPRAPQALDTLSDLSDTGALSDAQPFQYVPNNLTGEFEQLAASTNNPRFAAKMLGYEYKRFGDILHHFKPDNGLGPADNIIWHDNGDVFFNGRFVANFHDWAN